MKKIAFILCILLITALCAPVMAADAVYYVAPGGSDTAAGTIDAPLATLSKAAELAKGTGATIYLREGSYLVTETVELGSEHNGISIRILYYIPVSADTWLVDGCSIICGITIGSDITFDIDIVFDESSP